MQCVKTAEKREAADKDLITGGLFLREVVLLSRVDYSSLTRTIEKSYYTLLLSVTVGTYDTATRLAS